MNRQFLRLILLMLVAFAAGPAVFAQTDSLHAVDSTGRAKITAKAKDSLLLRRGDSAKRLADSARMDSAQKVYVKPPPDTSLQHFYRLNQHLDPAAPLIFRNQPPFASIEKDRVFYILLSLLFVLGLIRLLFSKYFNDLFRIFFQTTFRQKSIREQLLQNKMASLLLNIFFCISGGLFLYFLAQYKGWLTPAGLLKKAALCVALVTIVYTVKYIGLKISGWLFGMEDMAETYLFIVFLINKVVGVLLLPATVMLALGGTTLQSALLVVSLLSLALLYLYRYLIALPLVRNHAALTGFHFFIYLCAFEVVPVLLIYKFLIIILSR